MSSGEQCDSTFRTVHGRVLASASLPTALQTSGNAWCSPKLRHTLCIQPFHTDSRSVTKMKSNGARWSTFSKHSSSPRLTLCAPHVESDGSHLGLSILVHLHHTAPHPPVARLGCILTSRGIAEEDRPAPKQRHRVELFLRAPAFSNEVLIRRVRPPPPSRDGDNSSAPKCRLNPRFHARPGLQMRRLPVLRQLRVGRALPGTVHHVLHIRTASPTGWGTRQLLEVLALPEPDPVAHNGS
mmetsp:Transcript_24820/g.74030  ORF Transcript_24820/g.74030 Transcript_24820/m.74030 type:complete len:240 (-) Transcript_24820:117-836(-)